MLQITAFADPRVLHLDCICRPPLSAACPQCRSSDIDIDCYFATTALRAVVDIPFLVPLLSALQEYQNMAHAPTSSPSPISARRKKPRMPRPSASSLRRLALVVALSASAASAVVATQSSSSSSGSSSWSRGFDGARESFLETVLEANVSNQKSCKVRVSKRPSNGGKRCDH